MNATDIKQIKQFWTDVGFNDLELKLIDALVPWEERSKASEQAVISVASDHRLGEVELRELLGESGAIQKSHSVWGGQVGNRWKELCLAHVRVIIETYKDEIHRAICIEFQYCQKRRNKQFDEEGLALAIAVADGLLTFATGIPIPATWLSVYLVKTRLLDGWCKCKNNKKI